MKTRRRTLRLTLKKDREFWPPKYYRGLTLKQKIKRKKEFDSRKKYHWRNPKAYKTLKTNKIVKSKPSQYTLKWNEMFPNAKSLEDHSKVTGVPLKYIRESYNRGLAAWAMQGHRPGASQSSWAYPRIKSLLLCGKTHYTADADIVRRAKAASASARKWWSKQCRN
jgi:hypothetical protein